MIYTQRDQCTKPGRIFALPDEITNPPSVLIRPQTRLELTAGVACWMLHPRQVGMKEGEEVVLEQSCLCCENPL